MARPVRQRAAGGAQASPQRRGGISGADVLSGAKKGRRVASTSFLAAIAQAEAEDTRPRADPLTVTVPFPPSLNNAYVNVTTKQGQSRRVKTWRASEFAKTVKEHVYWHLRTIDCRPPAPPWCLTLHLYPPLDGQRHDASNTVKIPEDALMDAIGGDDDDVLEVHVYKHPKGGQPRLEMTLESASGPAEQQEAGAAGRE